MSQDEDMEDEVGGATADLTTPKRTQLFFNPDQLVEGMCGERLVAPCFFLLEVSLSKFMILWNHPSGTAKHHFLLVPISFVFFIHAVFVLLEGS